jgi:hypothetical protein
MKSDGSKQLKHDSARAWAGTSGGNTPPFNKKSALPKNMNKPFIKRFIEWWTA